MSRKNNIFSPMQLDRIIEMAWEDRTPFEAIRTQFGLTEGEVRCLMRKELRFSSYTNWRSRVERSTTKHAGRRCEGTIRFKSRLQRTITNNKISKR